MVDIEKNYISYKGTCHVILLAKLHDMYLYKTTAFSHQPPRSISKVAVLHRFYCRSNASTRNKSPIQDPRCLSLYFEFLEVPLATIFVQIQEWNFPFQKVKDERVKGTLYGTRLLEVLRSRLRYVCT